MEKRIFVSGDEQSGVIVLSAASTYVPVYEALSLLLLIVHIVPLDVKWPSGRRVSVLFVNTILNVPLPSPGSMYCSFNFQVPRNSTAVGGSGPHEASRHSTRQHDIKRLLFLFIERGLSQKLEPVLASSQFTSSLKTLYFSWIPSPIELIIL